MAADTANNEKIVRQTLEAFEAANERGIREGLARDFVFHNAPPGFTEDADGFVQLASVS
jgi:cytosine/adenosine deaminase-related metal-dependent hydrolase